MNAQILSKRLNEKYAHNGFIYIRDNRGSRDGERLFWRCEKQKTGCKGRIHTSSGENRTFLQLVTPHTCSETGDAVRVVVQQTVTGIKRRALTTMENPSQIRAEAVQGLSQAIMGA